MARTPRLLILRAHAQGGGDEGLVVMHETTLTALLGLRGWTVEASDMLDPRLPALVASADLVLIQMLAHPEVEGVVRARRALGLPTVFEIVDNFVAAADWTSEGHPLRSPLVRQSLVFHASLADAVQVYADGLVDLVAGVNCRVLRFDPYTPLPDRLPAKPPGFVFGWGGTATSTDELRAIAPAVVSFCARHPDATFAYMGDEDVFRETFGAIAPTQVQLHPFSAFGDYRDFVGGLHVGLIPRLPTPFNAGRSDWRLATYAANGAVAVVSDAPAHRAHAGRARLFGDAAALEAALDELYDDRPQLARLRDAARAWVVATRGEDAAADQRDAAYRELLADHAAPAAPPPARSGPDPAPGLAAARALGPDDALAAARKLEAAHPGYEQAQLLVLRSLERLGRHDEVLRYVAGLSPSPVHADAFAEVQVRCARVTRPAEVARLAAAIVSPFRRARCTTPPGPELHRVILEHQPYDHFALAGAIHLASRDDPASPELESLYARAALVAPEDVPADRRPAHLAGLLPHTGEP